MEGVGKCLFKNHNKYEGNFTKGKIEGKGVMSYPDETYYSGELSDGKRHGLGELRNKTDIHGK
jgi:hypothetical protein